MFVKLELCTSAIFTKIFQKLYSDFQKERMLSSLMVYNICFQNPVSPSEMLEFTHCEPEQNAKANPKSFLLQIARSIIFANPFPY